MPSESWKTSERRMAAILGGQRVPVTGRARGSTPDIEGVTVAGRRLAIEHKYGARLLSSRIVQALAQAEAAMRSEYDVPVVTLEVTDAGRLNLNRRLVLLDAELFVELISGGRYTQWTQVTGGGAVSSGTERLRQRS